MNSHRLTLALCGLVLVSGCATDPIPTSEAAPVPSERILTTKFSRPGQGTGEVIVKRDVSIGGYGCSWRVFVNGGAVADLRPAEKVVLHLPTGDHILGAEPVGAICGGRMSEVKTTVKAGETATFRVGFGNAGEFYINPTAF